jgi:large repetitive protein
MSLAVVGGGAPVTRIVRGPGDTRAVILLGAGARGTELTVQLVREADELSGAAAAPVTAVQVLLERAPWEVED